MTKVGGVIPAHNQARWIRDAIVSLRAEVDELVVVDDASSDGTTEILSSLLSEIEFRLVVNSTPLGVSEACNAGVRALDVDVVLMQGGDDRTLSGRRERSVAALADPGVSLVYSLPIVIDADDGVLPAEAAGEFFAGADIGDPLAFLFNQGNYICAPSVAVRRADYLEAGGFPAGIDLLQDYSLWLDLAVLGRFERVTEPLVEYRKHGSNLSREYVGVDSARLRRHAAEMIWIQNRFLDRVDLATLARVAHIPGGRGGWPELSRDELVLLVRVAHPDRRIVRRGLDDLLTMVANDGLGVLARLGLERGDLDRLAAIADHDNLAELGRAASTLRALQRLGGVTTGANGRTHAGVAARGKVL